jgi:TonB-linked SusC/RagA family outer membrane protein
VKRSSALLGGLLSGLVCAVNAQAAIPSNESAPATHRASPFAPSARQGGTSPLERRIAIDLDDVTLTSALDAIAREGHIDLSFTDAVVPASRRVTLKTSSMTVREALKRVLKGTGVIVLESPTGVVTLVRREDARGEIKPDTVLYGSLWGQVVDSATGNPLMETVIRVKGAGVSTITNEKGEYVFANLPTGVETIIARHLGFRPEEREVAIVEGKQVRVDFALRMGISRLQEVVTTATGPKRRLELGNDIATINADSIARTEPVTSVTDLLEGRVPGLVVQHTSGAPGDPSRLRLRGTSSVSTNNDPIVIVDGIRVYAAQSDARNRNLAYGNVATPSPLDEIDPHSIETIEVLKGPSAATLYGTDAANGVIVITTKRGRSGPPRWTASVDRGLTEMPGAYPESYVRWGHKFWDNAPVQCPPGDFTCTADSLVKFQLLNDPELTVLGRGNRTAATLGVSGGSDALQYSVNGNYQEELGLVRLPGLEVDRYGASHGVAPPDWMQRPQHLTQWGASSRLTAKLGEKADVSLTGMLSRTTQQRSSLEGELPLLMRTYLDRTTGIYYRQPTPQSGLTPVGAALDSYYRRMTDAATQFTNGVNFTWRPRTWLTAGADGGLNVIQREDAYLLPRDAALTTDSLGEASAGRGTSLVNTVNVRATATAPLPWGFRLSAATGANYTGVRTADLSLSGTELAVGGTSVGQAGRLTGKSEQQSQQATFGWYVEPTFSNKRVWFSTGLRLDGGNAFGSGVRYTALPKLSLSYLISDEKFFPKAFKSVFSTLRLRGAYGHAGVQPGPGDRLRLFALPTSTWVDGSYLTTVTLQTLGNSKIKPERSTELEGGFDADLFDDRLSLAVTGYRKTRVDALMQVPLPPSVYGAGDGITYVTTLKNIGVIRNTGYEISLGTQLLRGDRVSLGTQVSVSHNQNLVVSLGPNVQPFGDLGARVTPGYPLFGRWAKPVLAYHDRNSDGLIDPSEVLYGDTAVYLGSPEPNYTAALSTTLSLFRGAVVVTAGLSYESGLTQAGLLSMLGNDVLRGYNDPTAPLGEQASVVSSASSDFLNTQTISALRFNSLSIAYNVPMSMAQRIGARSLAVALQGTNLGLHTNYRGLDPNVNSASGNDVLDQGALPQPRTWQIRVSASY